MVTSPTSRSLICIGLAPCSAPSLDEIPTNVPRPVLLADRRDGFHRRGFLLETRRELEDHILTIRCARKRRSGRGAFERARLHLTKGRTCRLRSSLPCLLRDRVFEQGCRGVPTRRVPLVVDE